MNFLMSTTESDIDDAIAQIDSNCGWPNEYSTTWATKRKAYQQDIWYFKNPPVDGYTDEHESFTRIEMMDGVVNVTESDGDSSWYPPEDDN